MNALCLTKWLHEETIKLCRTRHWDKLSQVWIRQVSWSGDKVKFVKSLKLRIELVISGNDEAKSIAKTRQAPLTNEWHNQVYATLSKGDKGSLIDKQMVKLSPPNFMIRDKASLSGKDAQSTSSHLECWT